MPRLFTYTIPVDDGAAPNPFHGMCSLAICKPGIRRVAKKGDWVAGLGSKKAHSGDLSRKLVYAMRVDASIYRMLHYLVPPRGRAILTSSPRNTKAPFTEKIL